MDLMSAGLGDLVSKLFEIRLPFELSDSEAIAVAASVPVVAAQISSRCRLVGGGASDPYELYVRIACEDGPDGGIFSINLQTGQVVDVETRQVLQSVAASGLARRFLEDRERQRSALRKELQAACGG